MCACLGRLDEIKKLKKGVDKTSTPCYNKITKREKEIKIMKTIIVLELVCPFCGETHFVDVPLEELEAYEAGALAQEAFKSLNATEREQIISRLCPKCQAEIFG